MGSHMPSHPNRRRFLAGGATAAVASFVMSAVRGSAVKPPRQKPSRKTRSRPGSLPDSPTRSAEPPAAGARRLFGYYP
jgi:hypothetical protein